MSASIESPRSGLYQACCGTVLFSREEALFQSGLMLVHRHPNPSTAGLSPGHTPTGSTGSGTRHAEADFHPNAPGPGSAPSCGHACDGGTPAQAESVANRVGSGEVALSTRDRIWLPRGTTVVGSIAANGQRIGWWTDTRPRSYANGVRLPWPQCDFHRSIRCQGARILFYSLQLLRPPWTCSWPLPVSLR